MILSAEARMGKTRSNAASNFELLERRAFMAVTGLTATYYNDINFAGSSTTRTDRAIDFAWGEGAPAPSIDSDNFSVRWTGRVKSQTSETYRFYALTESPVRVWVGEALVVDGWR